MTVLPVTTCPSCWQHKDDPAKHYCTPCTEEYNRDYGPEHGPDCCEDLHCRLCFAQTGDGDPPGFETNAEDDDLHGQDDYREYDDDVDEPYGDRDFRRDVGI